MMSSGSRSGSSLSTRAGESPDASKSNTSTTRMRIPRTQGCPPHCRGSTVIRLAGVEPVRLRRATVPQNYVDLPAAWSRTALSASASSPLRLVQSGDPHASPGNSVNQCRSSASFSGVSAKTFLWSACGFVMRMTIAPLLRANAWAGGGQRRVQPGVTGCSQALL